MRASYAIDSVVCFLRSRLGLPYKFEISPEKKETELSVSIAGHGDISATVALVTGHHVVLD